MIEQINQLNQEMADMIVWIWILPRLIKSLEFRPVNINTIKIFNLSMVSNM